MKTEPLDTVITALMAFFALAFLALLMYFHGESDSHMVTLMCGLCLLCGGISAGWNLASRMGGDRK